MPAMIRGLAALVLSGGVLAGCAPAVYQPVPPPPAAATRFYRSQPSFREPLRYYEPSPERYATRPTIPAPVAVAPATPEAPARPAPAPPPAPRPVVVRPSSVDPSCVGWFRVC